MLLFANRREAGEKLAEKLKKYRGQTNVIILGIPRGGAAVGAILAKKLNLAFDLIIPRKLPIPGNPEMGFGAILSDGTILLNEAVVEAYGVTPEDVERVSQEVLEEVKRREKEYRDKTGFPKIKDKVVILVDDGLATGFTMLAAARAVKKAGVKEVIVAVPVSPENSIERVKPEVDEIICLHIQRGYESFAVASFYEDFHDLTDKEVRSFLLKGTVPLKRSSDIRIQSGSQSEKSKMARF